MKMTDTNEFEIPCHVTLYPLVLVPGFEVAQIIYQEIDDTVANQCVRLIEDYGDLEERINNLLNNNQLNSIWKDLDPLEFGLQNNKLQLFKKYLDYLCLQLKRNLRRLLINIRSGCENVDSLKQLLDRINNEQVPQNPSRLGQWLTEKEKEVRLVKRYSDQVVPFCDSKAISTVNSCSVKSSSPLLQLRNLL